MAENSTPKKLSSIHFGSSDSLKKMWDPVKRILFFSFGDEILSPQKRLSVSIEKGRVSIAYGTRSFSKIAIKGIKDFTFDEGKYPRPGDLSSAVVRGIEELKATGTAITLSIPKAWTVIRTAELPATVKENLPAVISYELDRLTPFTADEAYYDFRILNDTGEKITLLLMAAKADTIRPYIDALHENGLSVERVTVNIAAVWSLLREIHDNADTLFVDIDDKGYEGGLFQDGTVTSTFSEDFASGEEERMLESISADITSRMAAAQGTGVLPLLVVLYNRAGPALREAFRTRLQMPATLLNETDIGVKPEETEGSISYYAVAGVMESLQTGSSGLNLMGRGHEEPQKTPVALTVLLICTVLILVSLSFFAPLKYERKMLRKISREIAAQQADVQNVMSLKKQVESLAAELATIDTFKNEDLMALDVLKELTLLVPENTWLTQLKIGENSVEIGGYAESATELLPRLENSPLFKEVAFASPTVGDRKFNADRFSIKMEIEKEGKNQGT